MPESFMTRSGLNAHFVHSVDNALGDGVVAAAGAEGGLAAAVLDDGQADAVGFGGWICNRRCHKSNTFL